MHRTLLGSVAAAMCVLGANVATLRGQVRGPTQGVQLPPILVAAEDDALGAEFNPALLGFLPAWSVRYVHMDAPSDAQVVGRGDGVYVASPLVAGLALGLSVQSIRPRAPTGEGSRGLFSLALAYAPSTEVSIGGSLRYFASPDARWDDLFSLDLALALRPDPHWALSVRAQDALGPLHFTGAEQSFEAGYSLALAHRPWGDDRFSLEAGTGVDTAGQVGVRVASEIAVPYLGRLQATGELLDLDGDPELRALAGLMLDWGHLEAGGGAMAGDGLAGAAGWYLSAGVQGQARRASHHARVMLALRQDKALNARNVLPLLRQLEQARYRPSVGAVLLQLGGNMPMAYAQEIRQRTWALKRQGKAVYCDLAAASGNELYACSAATTRFLDPAGMVRLLGPAIDVLLFGKLLARLGVRAQFVRIGKYKSAPEQWTRPRMTRPAQAQRQALLDDLYGRLQQDLARDLRWSKAKVRRIIDKGPYAAGEAREQGLVDVLSDPHDVSAHIRARHGQVWPMRDKLPPPPHRHWGKGARVGVVVIDGTIIDGENLDVPLIDVHLTGGRTVVETLERFRRDPHIRAVVLRVDSPGGSALASDQIWRAVRRLAKQKSVIASMGAVAASGGYMAAAGADEIWADPATLTGSIGVFFGKVDLSMLARRLGVGVQQLRRGARAGATSMWRPFSADEQQVLRQKVAIWYRQFLARVAAGRGMSLAVVHKVAQGRVWSGDAALRVGLVDHLGGYAAALGRARKLAGLPVDAPVQVAPTRPRTLLEYLIKPGDEVTRLLGKAGDSRRIPVPAQLRQVLTFALTLAHTREGLPLAMMPAAYRAP